jgi:DNA-binding XRE family transcriptional regulator
MPKKRAMSEAERQFYGEIGRRLQAHRERAGMKQFQMARVLDVSPPMVCKYETGEIRCPLWVLVRYACVFVVPVAELISN